MRGVHHHVFSRIEKTPTQTDPFPHVYVRDVFPRDFYAHLIQQLPDDDRYQPFPPPLQARLSLDLKPDAAAELGLFWQTFESWINGQDFLNGMVRKFAQFLPHMRAHRASIVDANSSDGQVSVRSHTILNRDYANFALGPTHWRREQIHRCDILFGPGWSLLRVWDKHLSTSRGRLCRVGVTSVSSRQVRPCAHFPKPSKFSVHIREDRQFLPWCGARSGSE